MLRAKQNKLTQFFDLVLTVLFAKISARPSSVGRPGVRPRGKRCKPGPVWEVQRPVLSHQKLNQALCVSTLLTVPK